MTSLTTKDFRKAFKKLPKEVQRQAKRVYKLFLQDPQHPSLCFKQIHAEKEIFSVRISLGYRAMGVRNGDEMVWFWIGSHSDYNKLISRR